MKKILPKTKDCFCCGSNNPKGLNITYYFEHDKVLADFTPSEQHVISENILHPGIALGILFEAMSWVISYTMHHSMIIVDYNIRVLNPLSIGKKVTVKAEITHVSKLLSEVEGLLEDDKGNIYFKARGTFTYRNTNDEHIRLI